MWEYKRLDFSYKSITDVDKNLQKIGDEGWDIIVYIDVPSERRIKVIGKRLKKENNV